MRCFWSPTPQAGAMIMLQLLSVAVQRVRAQLEALLQVPLYT
jgi:hypothetical protein